MNHFLNQEIQRFEKRVKGLEEQNKSADDVLLSKRAVSKS
ncbi:hypothetical protein bthur0013_59810 [Bacillus thuringiensis IBL 200]|nr:hypothetical protein bthur0013_59810 [Bacillus thuringiensis IBL 200]